MDLSSIGQPQLLASWRRTLEIRRFEEHVIAQYTEQNAMFARRENPPWTIKCPTHLSIGQEAAAVGVCFALKPTDPVFSTHRCHAHYLAKGGDPGRGMAELYGRANGCAFGKGGSMHLVDPSVGMMGSSAIVGGSIPLAVGAAMAGQQLKRDLVAACFFGDGAVEQGVFHESLNLAAVRKIPVIFACENNLYATLSHQSTRQNTGIAQRAAAYGIPGVVVDGNDALAVFEVARTAVERARAGAGPTLIEAQTYRWYSHVGIEPDTGRMRRTAEELAAWKMRDPVEVGRQRCLDAGLTRAQLAEVEDAVEQGLAGAVAFARSGPIPASGAMWTDV